MRPHLTLSQLRNFKPTILASLLLAAFFALCAVGFVSSTAQSTQKQERELEDKIPKHLPIKVKVKNSEKVKDLNNDQWMRDVEIEIQNTGDKPIYYLRLSLYFVDVKLESGAQLGFPIDYGNPQFVDFEKRAMSQDVPLRPGETYVYQFSKRWAGRWEKFKVKRQLPHPNKIGLQFEVLSYGDGTGFVSTGGTPIPNKQGSNSECGTQNKAAANLKAVQETLPNRPPVTRFQSASFLTGRVPAGNFFALHPTSPTPRVSPIQSGICCPSTSCFNLKLTLGGNCFCEDELGDPPLEAGSAACGTVGSICGTQGTNQFICDDNEHTCTSFFIIPCITPTPTPTPDSTPSPTPTPCDPPEATQPNDTCVPFGPCPPQGTRGWLCASCPSGFPVNNPAYPNSGGCPDGYYNDGQYCCVPVNPTPTPTPFACTTPGFNGGCLPGLIPNEYGMCCPALGGLGELCPDPPAAFQCGTVLPETACPYTIYGFGSCYSPILVDVAGDGFRLTDARRGVRFDIDGNPDGLAEQVSWTVPSSDDAWLALDRNRNGRVDSGRELFGNLTLQPASAEGNGFIALAQYDRAKNGGNEDGVIDARDGFFPLLRLWQDRNHNGVSEAGELHSLPALGVTALYLDYKESKRVDEFGNQYRYRAKVEAAKGARINRWAWDVFLVKVP